MRKAIPVVPEVGDEGPGTISKKMLKWSLTLCGTRVISAIRSARARRVLQSKALRETTAGGMRAEAVLGGTFERTLF